MNRMRTSYHGGLIMLLTLALAGCGTQGDAEARQVEGQDSVSVDPSGETPLAHGEQVPVEPDGGIGDGAAPLPGGSETNEDPVTTASEKTPKPQQERGFSESEEGAVDPGVLQRTDLDDPTGREVIPVAAGPEVMAGTRLNLVSDIQLSTDESVEGDPVIATVTEDLLAPDGMVLIPEGARLLGRVVRLASSTGPDSDPVIEILFETLSTAEAEWPIHATVVEMAVVAERKDSDARTAAKIGGAAAAGAILGKIIGGDKGDAAKGGVVGAVAGTVIAMETRPGEAVLPVGAPIVVELQKALVLN